MANTNLTVDQVTNHALMVLHQKLNFIGTINRQYDDSYKMSGAKGGDSIRIRLPNEYTVRTGKTLDVQDTTQRSVTLQTATQKGVDMNFSMQELTQDINLFNENFIEPAMSVLAANIESDAMSMYKSVYNETSDIGQTIVLADVLAGARILTEALPGNNKRCLNMNTRDNADLVNALSGLFNDPAKISANYREGMVANQFVGFDKVFENTLWPIHTTGTDDGTGDYLTNGAATEGSTALVVDTGAGTWKAGDIFTVADVFRVHPETKVSTGILQRFVCTNDEGVSTVLIEFTPAMRASGGSQNVDALAATAKAVTKQELDGTAIAASADYYISMGYCQNAFAFATADLEIPDGVHFAARKVSDGLSLRIVRDYDINNDNMPTRIDILYGFKAIRPELAVRYGFN